MVLPLEEVAILKMPSRLVLTRYAEQESQAKLKVVPVNGFLTNELKIKCCCPSVINSDIVYVAGSSQSKNILYIASIADPKDEHNPVIFPEYEKIFRDEKGRFVDSSIEIN